MGTQGLEGKFDEGLQVLLAVAAVKKLHGVFPLVNLLQYALQYARQKMEDGKKFPEIALVWASYAKIAEQLSVIERQRVPTQSSPLDVEPRMWHAPEIGKSYIVVGGGPQEGGYAIELSERGPNRMILR